MTDRTPTTAEPRPVPIEEIAAAMADPLVGPMVDAMLGRPEPRGEGLREALSTIFGTIDDLLRYADSRFEESAEVYVRRAQLMSLKSVAENALAATPPAPALDVERLTEAIAREYAALAPERQETPPDG